MTMTAPNTRRQLAALVEAGRRDARRVLASSTKSQPSDRTEAFVLRLTAALLYVAGIGVAVAALGVWGGFLVGLGVAAIVTLVLLADLVERGGRVR